jgi:hypothetical protein
MRRRCWYGADMAAASPTTTSRQVVQCVACEHPHMAVADAELAGEELDAYVRCARCAGRDGFTRGALGIDDLRRPLATCIVRPP